MVLTLFSMFTVGCSLDAQLIKLSSDIESTYEKTSVVEGVAVSHQYERTAGRQYIVQGSAGTATSKLTVHSNTRGYQIYQNVQGQLISEDPR